MIDPGPLLLTFKLSLVTTLVLLVIGLPVSYWLSHSKGITATLSEALIGTPLILPPTVLGFYILTVFGGQSPIGNFIDQYLGLQLVFSFEGLVLGSIIYSLPFMVYPVVSGFRNVPSAYIDAAKIMGHSSMTIFMRVLLPTARKSVITGAVLTFAHTVGEFGVVLMIGGNIPGETRVGSVAIYDFVEALEYQNAHIYSGIMLVLALSVLFLVYLLNRKNA